MTLLVQAVEDLTAAGYVVLTAQQAEEVTAFLGLIAFEDGDDRYGDEAERLLSEWPASNTGSRSE